MKKIFFLFFIIQFVTLQAYDKDNFILRKDKAQYGKSSYNNVVWVERNISLERAFEIAQNNPDIDYFFFTKGYEMVLVLPSNFQYDKINDPFHLIVHTKYISDSNELKDGYCRIFNYGDTVFFKKKGMWFGSANGLADVYLKKSSFEKE
jgi:hypothetical protein